MSYFYQYVKFKSSTPFVMTDGSNVGHFILCTQPPDMGYGASSRKILNKDLSIGDIRYQVSNGGLQQVQNTTISFSNVGQFYHAMRELNGDDFWNTLQVSIYWATGRVPTLVYNGTNWMADDESIIAFIPSEPYPLLNDDFIKKEFEGTISSASISKDKITLSLVSQSKQDSFLVGTIQSFNGADSSRSLINPILLGDLTDDNAFVPLVLKNAITSTPTGICSDIPLFDAPTVYIYDDENEKFHQVINEQKATNSNKQIEFYNEDESLSFITESDFIKTNKIGDLTNGPIFYSLSTGEVVGYFTNTKNYVVFNSYGDALNYHITSTTNRLRDEGTRDYNDDDVYNDGELTGFLLDSDMAIGIAKINLSLYPINIKNTAPVSDIESPSSNGVLGFKQDPGGIDDFKTNNDEINGNRSVFFGSFKNFVNYKKKGPKASHLEPNYNDDTGSIWLNANALDDSLLSSDWEFYNYTNKMRVGVTADFEKFKYDSDIIDIEFFFYGAVYKDWNYSNDIKAFYPNNASTPPKTIGRSLITIDAGIYHKKIHDTSSLYERTIISDSLKPWYGYEKLSDFYENPPSLTFNGFTAYNPVKYDGYPEELILDPTKCFLDRADPSFYGSSRFAIDGMRTDMTVKARVESKYWCFKGRTGTYVSLVSGLNTLAIRYNNTVFSLRDHGRSDWMLSGVHVGDPIYYRDLLSKICNEFRAFITDKNGGSGIVSMGRSSSSSYTIDESNSFSPWFDNISFSETESTEIYNKIVVRYAKNHMTKRYGKTVSFSDNEVLRTFGVEKFSNSLYLKSFLQIAKNTLSKIGITEKVKTIDLDWVRDDYTANKIIEWWCKNSYRQRAIVSVNVSKVKLIEAQIGDVVDLDFPKLPDFYKTKYQITKIVNKSDKTLSLELEEIL